MKKVKLTKIIVSLFIASSILGLNPIRVNAEWKQDSTGWWYTEGDSWSVGWKEINGQYYYLKANGYMAYNTIIDGYKLGADGTRIGTSSTEPITNHNLSILTNANYDSLIKFSEGLAVVHNDSGFSYIDTSGNVKIGPMKEKVLKDSKIFKVEDASDFHEGRAFIKDSKGIGDQVVIDTNGNEVFQVEEKVGNFLKMNSYMNGISVATTEETEGYDIGLVDKNGKETLLDTKNITSNDFTTSANICSDNLLLYRSKNQNKLGYIDVELKKIAIKPQFEDARIFYNGIAAAKSDGKWGFINKNGIFIIQPQYEDFYVNDANYSYKVFNNDIESVKKNGKWGAINKEGRVVVDFKYDSGFSFVNGLAYVKENGKYGYIDIQGKEIIGIQYDDANVFNNNVALVGKNGVYYLIDKDGRKVSSETWNFEGSFVNSETPDMISYKQNGKWGLAKIK